MKRKAISRTGFVLMALAGLAAASGAYAQGTILPPMMPQHFEPNRTGLGAYPGSDPALNNAGTPVPITASGAPWMRIVFEDWRLGPGSYLTLMSAHDGSLQRLDGRTIGEAAKTSAAFNGDTVFVELHPAADDPGAYVRLNGLIVGEWVGGMPEPLSICGPTDDRVSSSDLRVFRMVVNNSASCTGWLISNGWVLSAGHCVDFDPDQGGPALPDGVLDYDDNDFIEWDPPDSTAGGTPQFAPADRQYTTIASTFDWRFDGEGQGIGKDWARFAVRANTTTGLNPFEANGSFHRTTNGNPVGGSTIRITGHGTDNTPLTSNQIQQTHSGPYSSETVFGADQVSHFYAVDTTGGNSGSPIMLATDTRFTFGIHTNAGCTSGGGNNSGTSFEVNLLETSIDNAPNSFPATYSAVNTTYLDHTKFNAGENGTIFFPHDTLIEAVATASANGKISMAAGTYTGSAQTITKAMFLVAPVGSVVLQ